MSAKLFCKGSICTKTPAIRAGSGEERIFCIMVRRKDGRWQEQVGKKYFYGKTKSEVLRKIADWTEQEEKGRTFAEVLDEWDAKRSADCEAGKLAYNSYAANKATVAKLREKFGDRRIREVTPQQLQAYLSSMTQARRTVQMYLDVLRMVFRYAVVSGYVDASPCDALTVPRGLKTEKREIPESKDIELVKAGYDLPFGMFAYFALYSGLRRGELLALRWDDIDFSRRQIRVSRSLYWEVNQPRIKEPKTAAGTRIVPLLDPLAEKLKPGKGYVFPGSDGEPMTQTVFRRRWNNYCRSAGLADAEKHFKEGKNGRLYGRTTYTNRIEPHQLRHAFATICFEADIPARDAMDILGHSSIKVTEDIYTHIRDSRRNETAEKLNSYLREKPVHKKYRRVVGRL